MKARAVGPAAAVAAALLFAPPTGVGAQPALDRGRDVGPLTLYPDAAVPNRFYYLPGPLELAERNGRPAIRFVLTRRVGTAVRGSQGESHHFAHLSFDVEQREVGADALESARAALRARGVSRPGLRPLPLRGVEATVVFAPLGGAAADTVAGGDFETAGSAGLDGGSATGAFGRRRYTLRLEPASAEALWRMLESERTLVSFGYAYLARGVVESGGELTVSGDLAGDATFAAPEPEAAHPGGSVVRAVRADAFEVGLDPERDGDLIRVVDLDAHRSPPAYGVLDVRCYDFRSGLRPDLALKTVHLEGEAVNGRTVREVVVFRAAEPAAAVHRVRFPYAVRIDRPLRYRVVEIATDGERRDHGWEERSWIGVLDVSTRRDRLVELATGEAADRSAIPDAAADTLAPAQDSTPDQERQP